MPKPLFWLTCLSLLLLNANPTYPQSLTRDTKPRNCSISGRVTIKGKPAVNVAVLVTLTGFGLLDAALGGKNDGVFAKASTDAEGRYQIQQLPPGELLVRAASSAYVLKPGATTAQSTGDVNGITVKLFSGDQRDGVDLELIRGGVITGRVTDSGGRPLPKEPITLSEVDKAGDTRPAKMGTSWDEDQTDDRGIYRLFGIAPGLYVVSAGANTPLLGSSRYMLRFYSDAADTAKAKVLEVTEGSELTGIDFHLPKAAKPEERRTFVAKGQVLDAETGKPVVQADISAYEQFGVRGRATTDAQGVFQMAGLPNGSYQLQYQEPNPLERPVLPGYFSEPVSFEIADADTDNLVLRLLRGTTVSGTVVVEGQRPTLRDQAPVMMISARTPPGEAGISVAGDFTQAMTRNSAVALVQNDGQFRVSGLRPGRVTFDLQEMQSTEKHAAQLQLVRIERAGANLGDALEVGAKEQIAGVRVIVRRIAGVLRGRVNFSGGPLPKDWSKYWQLDVMLLPSGAQLPGGNSGSEGTGRLAMPIKWDRVDEQGQFEFGSLEAGSFTVAVRALPVSREMKMESPFETVHQAVFVNAQGETNVTVTMKVKVGGKQ